MAPILHYTISPKISPIKYVQILVLSILHISFKTFLVKSYKLLSELQIFVINNVSVNQYL
jgi:hypothetical protein